MNQCKTCKYWYSPKGFDAMGICRRFPQSQNKAPDDWCGEQNPYHRELTDEEIFKIAIENGAWKSKESGNVYPDDMYILNFARAILKKASEK